MKSTAVRLQRKRLAKRNRPNYGQQHCSCTMAGSEEGGKKMPRISSQHLSVFALASCLLEPLNTKQFIRAVLWRPDQKPVLKTFQVAPNLLPYLIKERVRRDQTRLKDRLREQKEFRLFLMSPGPTFGGAAICACVKICVAILAS